MSTLVLPGGGARGAYQAGAIEGLRRSAGIGDGDPLPGVNAVVGTSIGAINGWFVATARYSVLADIWQTIASAHIFRLKRQYAGMPMPSSSVLTRIFQAALIDRGLTNPVPALLDGRPIHHWLTRHVDPATPLLANFLFTLTNVNGRRPEIFYRAKSSSDPGQIEIYLSSLFDGTSTVRKIEDPHLVEALAGSSAVPVLLDPVTIDFSDGPRTYIDGGVANSEPITLARAFADRVDLVLVDAKRAEPRRSWSSFPVSTDGINLNYNRAIEIALESAHIGRRGKTPFRELYVMRPERDLPVQVAGFDDADGIAKTYQLGLQAGLRGYREYDPGSVVA